jgi:hypothetical protein
VRVQSGRRGLAPRGSRQLVPPHGFLVILWHAFAFVVDPSDSRRRAALEGRKDGERAQEDKGTLCPAGAEIVLRVTSPRRHLHERRGIAVTPPL